MLRVEFAKVFSKRKMVHEIQKDWCRDLENLLDCPVCFELPIKAIYQCIEGHHVCQGCKPKLTQCPQCSQPWSDSRNRLVEHLCLKLGEMKIALNSAENEIKKLVSQDKVSVASQTDGVETPVKKKPWESHKGKIYPCKIGSCNTKKSYDVIVKHLVTDHPEKCSEAISDGNVFQHSWTLRCAQDIISERAFLISNMGTFFFKLSIDVSGNYSGFTLMIHKESVAKKFTFQMELSCCSEHAIIYPGEVCSCRILSGLLREKSICINLQDIEKMFEHKNELTCTVLIGRKSLTGEQASFAKQ